MASTATAEKASLDQWYVIDASCDITDATKPNRLLSCDIETKRDDDGTVVVTRKADRAVLPSRELYGYVWTTLGSPSAEPVDIPETGEPDRQYVPCGPIAVRASGLRVVENFLDMAHFPYIHTDVLGIEPHTEVPFYSSEIRRDVDEVWATNCQFYQPQIVVNGPGGMVQLSYRVPSPFVVMLYRVCPSSPERLDVIAMFIQPLEECLCRAQPVMYLVDDQAPHVDLLKFEQAIFLQDRIIVENQRPVLLPLEPRSEIPTRADLSSVTYRRWLKEKGLRYGTAEAAGI
jgi:phenylpropionate dioxygenase-like ring-hydroxylating dioxygenase large terminal subunit